MNATTNHVDAGVNARASAATWQGERLLTYTCALGSLAGRLPQVERRPFMVIPLKGLQDVGVLRAGQVSEGNPYYDLVVRVSDTDVPQEVPLGIVSKRYRLVQHRELLDGVIQGLRSAQVPWESLETDVRITELGSRLHFSVHLPETFRAPIEDDGLDLTIECLNSVDRSWAFRVGMGWIRLVCGNGLFIGRLTANLRHLHIETLHVEGVPALVATGFKAAEADAAKWRTRAHVAVTTEALERWADHTVAPKWGVLAAARTLHIVRTGVDAWFSDAREKAPPSRRAMTPSGAVPGCQPPNDNIFRVGQVLAWLANGLGEWGARLERRRQVPELLAPLVRVARVLNTAEPRRFA